MSSRRRSLSVSSEKSSSYNVEDSISSGTHVKTLLHLRCLTLTLSTICRGH